MERVEAGMVQPRRGRYGICGWDVIVKGMECILFKTKKMALAWMKTHGYAVVG